MKGTLVKIVNFLDSKCAFEREFKIFPIFSLEVFKGFFGKKINMSRILIRLNRGVLRDIYNDPGTGLADAVNFLKQLNQIIYMFEQVAAEHFVHRTVPKTGCVGV